MDYYKLYQQLSRTINTIHYSLLNIPDILNLARIL